MKKIVTILGARPQFVKAAVLSRVIRKHNQLKEVIIHTGQHFDNNMSDVFFEQMEIPKPSYNLDINGLGHGAMTGQMMEKIEEVLIDEKPDIVVVYGDTNSTLAGALAAKKLHIKVAHIEAGLRSFNMKMPEEVNRILTDRISDYLFCPTKTAIRNLKKEGFDHLEGEVIHSGDIMKDAVSYYSSLANAKGSVLGNLRIDSSKIILATIHRQENTDDAARLTEIFKGLDAIQELGFSIIMPLHPRTSKAIEREGIQSDITMIDPVGYFEMLQLLEICELVITDSGGLQKEAFFCEKGSLVLRDQTEWVELIDKGYAMLIDANANEMVKSFLNRPSISVFEKDIFGDDVGELIHRKLVLA